MADLQQLFKKYGQYSSTFKETSYDDKKNIFLCTDTTQDVLNFDIMIKDKYKGIRERPKSFDALYKMDNTLYLVEFKNQLPSQINRDKISIQRKLVEGKKELDMFLAICNIQKNDYKFKFCVVYKNFRKPYDGYKRGIAKHIIEFGLKKHSNLVNGIKTDSVLIFTQLLSKNLIPITLNCENN